MRVGEVTRLLHRMRSAASEAERHELFNAAVELVYARLRRIARGKLAREPADSRQATDLVHDAWIRLSHYRMSFNDSRHFLNVAAAVMWRLILERHRTPRPHDPPFRTGLSEDGYLEPWHGAADLSQAESVLLVREARDALTAQQAEFFDLHHVLGYSIAETAKILGLKTDTAKRRWRVIKGRAAQRLAKPDTNER
jgi:RNA polymerase sigma factor (sigma-70 family)